MVEPERHFHSIGVNNAVKIVEPIKLILVLRGDFLFKHCPGLRVCGFLSEDFY